jgi:MATE family multidrug resistance protein
LSIIKCALLPVLCYLFENDIAGIALGTLAAQYTGLIVTLTILYIYYGKLFKHINIRKSFKLNEVKSFFAINGNLFIRSLCFLCVYAGFTGIAAKYGDTRLLGHNNDETDAS